MGVEAFAPGTVIVTDNVVRDGKVVQAESADADVARRPALHGDDGRGAAPERDCASDSRSERV